MGDKDGKRRPMTDVASSVGNRQQKALYTKKTGRGSKMRDVKSVGNFNSIHTKIKQKRPMRAVKSMPDIRNPMRSILMQVPMYAIHGMAPHVRKMSRSISRNTLYEREASEDDSLIPDVIGHQGCTFMLSVAVFAALMAPINFGYNIAVLNTPEDVMREALGQHGSPVGGFSWAIVVSIFNIGGLIGSSIAPPMLDTIGRRRFMLINAIFLTFAILFESLAVNVMTMALARLLVGISCGGTSVAVPLYLGEIAPVSLRGSLGTLNQFSMVVGILLAQVLGRPLGTPETWRYLLAFGAVFSIIQVFLYGCIVESPRWLVMNNEPNKAEKTLRQLRGSDEEESIIQVELESMQALTEQEKKEMTVGTLVRNPRHRLPFAIGVTLMLFQQWSGINAVFYYSTGFFKKAQFEDPYLGTVLTGAVNVLATGMAVELMDRAGRKALLVLSSAGMAASAILLTAALVASDKLNVDLGYIEVMGVLAYVAFFEFGLGPIPWAITGELFGAVERATAMGAASTVNWIASFVIGLVFPEMNTALGNYCFLPFVFVTLVSVVFSHYVVPETKGKTLEEIRIEMFKRPKSDEEDSAISSRLNDSRDSDYGPDTKSSYY